MTERSSEGLDARRKRLLFRAWRRGVRADPLVQAVLTRFPGAEIVDVRAAADVSGGAPEELPFVSEDSGDPADDDRNGIE